MPAFQLGEAHLLRRGNAPFLTPAGELHEVALIMYPGVPRIAQGIKVFKVMLDVLSERQ
ncbi:hypothetical protein [Xenorhabdus lircayensis]|uniref:hypothetical protein n=1 Tax=Xenorhabdus lircayensis TaxID=2763499 RepID=UPI001E3538B9|nr:hypothetical protein [Xenorhabdus lircayensis]